MKKAFPPLCQNEYRDDGLNPIFGGKLFHNNRKNDFSLWHVLLECVCMKK